MSTPRDPAATVTMSEIAEIAGVSRSAASNWRRRFKDFPKPVGTGAGGGEVFLLADVEEWLKKHDRAIKRRSPAEALWHLANRLRDAESVESMVEIACAALALHRLISAQPKNKRPEIDILGASGTRPLLDLVSETRPDLVDAFTALEDLSRDALEAVHLVFQSTDPEEAGTAAEELLELGSRAYRYRRNESATSETLRELVARVADPQPDQTVYDMAAGLGGFLLDAALVTNNRVRLVGEEINERTRRLAILRLLAHGIDAEIALGNSLLYNHFGDLQADLIVCDPPYNLRDWGVEQVAGDPRWRFGMPSKNDANLAWIQHALYHLREGGHALVLLPAGSLFRGGIEARIRVELLKSGAIEAVVALPRGLAETTSIPLTLWVLRSPSSQQPRDVLMIDASNVDVDEPKGRGRRSLGEETIAAISGTLAGWRAKPAAFESIPGFAGTVSVLELLATEASLAPGRWVQAPAEADSAAVEGEIDRAAERLIDGLARLSAAPALPKELPITAADGTSPPWRIRDLADEGHVSILRATRITPDDYRQDGAPVLMQSDLRGRRDESERKHVNLEELRAKPVLTEPGDVILATIGEKPYAVVDREGGYVLGGSLQALRIHCDWLDPDVVAAFLSSSRTAQFSVGVAIRHVKLQDLELPRLTDAETAGLKELLASADATAQVAAEAAEAAVEVKKGLIEGLVSGSIRLIADERKGGTAS